MTRANKDSEEVALSNCEREKIHLPGRIQTFGMLFGIERSSLQVRYVSQNAADVLQRPVAEILGTDLDDLFDDRQLTHALRGGFAIPTLGTQRERLGVFNVGGSTHDVAVASCGETITVELEPVSPYDSQSTPPVALVRSMISQLPTHMGVPAMLESAVVNLRRLSGFDRVMAYQFLHRGEGEITAEAKSPAVEPYLGLRYPAWDIPQNARNVMIMNPFRAIRSIDDEHSSIVSEEGVPPLDVSLTHLRGVSPIYIEYLQNMGVKATMNIGLIVRGELWGMFAFHHYRRKLLVPEHRSICELFGHLISLQIQQQLEQTVANERRRADSVLRSLSDATESDAHAIFKKHAESISGLIQCDGLALIDSTQVSRWGTTPDQKDLYKVADACQSELASFETLEGILDTNEKNSIVGALVVELNAKRKISLAFCRREVIQEIRWAGANDVKDIKHGPNGPRLHPRSSFAEYRESVRGRCRPWTDADVAVALQVRSTLRDLILASSDAVAVDLQKRKKHQDLLIAELNHRVKNILALVRSIATQTRDSAQSLEQYIVAFEQRIAALSNAHDLIGSTGVQWARLRHLLDAELTAFRTDDLSVLIEGPPIALRADVAPIVALVLHELTSNAVKHGALSPNGLSLQVEWRKESGGLAINWRERLRERLVQPTRQGFGLTLIRRAVPHELNGECSMDFTVDGLEVRFWIPADAVQEIVDAPRAEASSRQDTQKMFAKRNDRTAIVVEDNMVLAMEMESLLSRQGFTTIHSFSKTQGCRDAFSADNISSVEVAILDVNLGSETSIPLARWLVTQHIPIVFVTGYDERTELPEELRTMPKLRKPVNEEQLSAAISLAIGADQ